MGDAFFTSPNPPFGAVFTYYLKDGLKSQKAARRETRDRDREGAGGDTPYPAWDALRAEDREQAPAMYLVVRDASRAIIVRQVECRIRQGSASQCLGPAAAATRSDQPHPADQPYWMPDPVGPLVLPGSYTARLATERNGILQEMGESQTFVVKPLDASPEITNDRRALQAFQLKVAGLQRAVAGSSSAIAELDNRIAHVRAAIVETPSAGDAERSCVAGNNDQAGGYWCRDSWRCDDRRKERTGADVHWLARVESVLQPRLFAV